MRAARRIVAGAALAALLVPLWAWAEEGGTAPPAAPAKAAAAKAAPAKAAPVKAESAKAAPVKAESAKAASVSAAPVIAVPDDAAPAESAASTAEERLKLKAIHYEAALHRDPFDVPSSDGMAGQSPPTSRLEVASAVLVGMLETPRERIALVEDANGESYALREGDAIRDGHVAQILNDTLVAWLQRDGIQQRIQLRLAEEGEL